jgi:hypothetical protein
MPDQGGGPALRLLACLISRTGRQAKLTGLYFKSRELHFRVAVHESWRTRAGSGLARSVMMPARPAVARPQVAPQPLGDSAMAALIRLCAGATPVTTRLHPAGDLQLLRGDQVAMCARASVSLTFSARPPWRGNWSPAVAPLVTASVGSPPGLGQAGPGRTERSH